MLVGSGLQQDRECVIQSRPLHVASVSQRFPELRSKASTNLGGFVT